MIPITLKLSNFTSYGEDNEQLAFTKFHLAAISGNNGAGKSSLLDAITWCVWGWSRSGDNADQLVRLGAHEMYVEFSFDLDGHTFTIKRSRSLKSGGSSALELWSTSNNLTEGTIKSTQQKIIDLLHLSFETFTNSSFLRQGHADEFTTKGPNDRKRILADILGLSHYDKLELSAKERVKEADNLLKLLEYKLLEIEAELNQKNLSQEKKLIAEKKITEVEGSISTLEKELKALTSQAANLGASLEGQSKIKQTLSSLQEELDQILSQGKSKADQIKQLESQLLELPKFDEKLKELKTLEKKKDEYTLLSQKKLELVNSLTKIKSVFDLKNAEKENLEKKLSEVNSHLQVLDKDKAICPTCGQEINKSQKDKLSLEYLNDQKKLKLQIAEIKTSNEEKEILNLQTQIKTIALDDQKFQQIQSKLNELSNLQQKREELIAAQATLTAEKKAVSDLRTLFVNKKSQVDKLTGEVSALPNLEKDLSYFQNNINQKELALQTLRHEEKEARNELGQATQLLTRAEHMQKVFDTTTQEKNNLQKERNIYEELSLAFGKKGIQAMIIETAIPEIETETNKLLNKLTDGRMRIELRTQRETKTKLEDGEKGIIETLDIIISDEMGDRPYEMYSGGEAFRVNFSIRLALSKLLTRRAGAKLQFLVIDEGFGTQDVEGRTKIVEVLDTIKDDFEKILIITHLDELKEEFPVRIEVSKNATGSTFEVIGV